MFFFDTYALVEFNKGNEDYRQYFGLPIYTSIFNLYEFFYSVLAQHGEEKARQATSKLNANLVPLEIEDIVRASKFRLKHKGKKLSYADALGYETARHRKLIFLTGDMQFKEMKNVEYVK